MQTREVDRLRMACTHLADAQIERVWAISSAHQAGISIRQIAEISDLSPSRVHQILNSTEAAEIPAWLTQFGPASKLLCGPDSAAPTADLNFRLAEESRILRRCIDWLDQMETGESVVVNLRLETEAETEYFQFDRMRVFRVLGRIASDLEILAAGGHIPFEGEDDPVTQHRRQLAEPQKTAGKAIPPRGAERHAGKAEAFSQMKTVLHNSLHNDSLLKETSAKRFSECFQRMVHGRKT